MLSSWQISQLHAQQSQAFGGMQPRQLSPTLIGPYQGNGIGATGMNGGFGQGSGYNYSSSLYGGYGPGNTVGNTMTSLIGGGISSVGGAGKFVGAGAGFMMGGLKGAMMGWGAGGLIGGAISHIGNSMMEGAQEQAAIERTLSQFQFSNSASRTGRGFTRNDSQQIGNMVRQMERIPEMLTSFGELNKLMDKMGQMGLMQGVRDAGEFMKKFQSTVSTLKDLAKVMGTTMEGALQSFGEARMSGFYSQGDITRNVLNRQITASLTGMNQNQIGALQQYGSQLGHAMGGSRKTGAQHALRTTGQLGMANQMGILTNDQIMEMTGKEGAEGIQDLSVQMTQLGYSMGRSNVGQALTLALGEQKDGRYTGKMDQELVEAVRRGEISLGELKSLARSKARTRGAKLSFAAHKQRLRAEMVGAVGAEGISMQLKEILGNRGWNNPDAINLVMQRFGASEEQANLMQQLMPNLQNIGSEMSLQGKSQTNIAARTAAMREHGWDAIKHKIGRKLAHATTDWAKDMGNSVRSYFQEWADDFIDDISGQYKTHITKGFSDTLRNSIGGSASAKKRLRGMIDAGNMSASSLGPSRLDIGSRGGFAGLASRTAHWLSGIQTSGEQAEDVLKLVGSNYLQTTETNGWGNDLVNARLSFSESSADAAARSGGAVLSRDSGFWTDSATSIRNRDLTRAERNLRKWDSQDTGQKMFANLGTQAGISGRDELVKAYREAMSDPSILSETRHSERMKKIWSKISKSAKGSTLKQLKENGWSEAQLIGAIQGGEKALGNKWEGAVSLSSVSSGLLNGLDVSNQAGISRAIEEQDRSMTGKLKSSDTAMGWSEVKGMIDSGDSLMNLLVGFNGNAGALGGGQDVFLGGMKDGKQTWGGKGKEGIMQLLSLDPTSWENDENVRKTLRDSFGVDPTELAKRLRDPKERTRILGLLKNKNLKGDDLRKRMALTSRSATVESAGSFQRAGNDLSDRLTGQYSEAAKSLSGSKEGSAVVGMLRDRAKALQGVTGDNLDQYTDNSGQIAMAIRSLSPKEQKLARELAGESVAGAGQIIDAGYSQFTSGAGANRKLRKGKAGMGVDKLLEGLGINLGNTNADMEFKKEVGGIIGKDGLSDMGELNKVLEFLGNRQGKGLIGEGTSANSKYMSEQDIANSLKVLSDNNVAVATILGNIAAGKTGAAIAEGVGKK